VANNIQKIVNLISDIDKKARGRPWLLQALGKSA